MAELGISEEAPAGARESAEDAGISEVPPLPPPSGSADPVDAAVLALLAEEPLPADVLLERIVAEGHAAPRVQQRLLMLELDGRLRQLPGRIYAPARRSDG